MLHFHETNEFICIWGFGGGGGEGTTYSSMFYMIGHRLNDCHFLSCFMHTHAFLSPMLSYFPVFFVVTGRCVDKGSLDR